MPIYHTAKRLINIKMMIWLDGRRTVSFFFLFCMLVDCLCVRLLVDPNKKMQSSCVYILGILCFGTYLRWDIVGVRGGRFRISGLPYLAVCRISSGFRILIEACPIDTHFAFDNRWAVVSVIFSWFLDEYSVPERRWELFKWTKKKKWQK